VPLFLALLAGIALMGGIAVLEDLGKHKDSEGDKKEEEKSSLVRPADGPTVRLSRDEPCFPSCT
jgi:hypothetical protein